MGECWLYYIRLCINDLIRRRIRTTIGFDSFLPLDLKKLGINRMFHVRKQSHRMTVSIDYNNERGTVPDAVPPTVFNFLNLIGLFI